MKYKFLSLLWVCKIVFTLFECELFGQRDRDRIHKNVDSLIAKDMNSKELSFQKMLKKSINLQASLKS